MADNDTLETLIGMALWALLWAWLGFAVGVRRMMRLRKRETAHLQAEVNQWAEDEWNRRLESGGTL